LHTAAPTPKSVVVFRVVAASLIAAAVASPASASKRNPAPISYASGSSAYPAGEPQYIEPSRAPDAEVKKKKRIEFRYPDQPDMVYGAAGARKAEQETPMAFSSSAAAIAPSAARKYASAAAPEMSQSAPAFDPALTPGSFDARAAAARAEAQRQVAAVESQPLQSVPMAPVVPAVAPAVQQPMPAQTVASVVGSNVPVFDEAGVGIVYGDEFNGLPTANGEMFDANALTAAHPSLPLPSLVQVTNLQTGREVVVRVNDRGPFEDGAMLQVSQRAAAELGMSGEGRAQLSVRYLGAAPAAPATSLAATYPAALAAQPAVEAAVYQPAVTQSATKSFTFASYAPASPVAPAPAMVGVGDYFVQLGSFSDIANAQELSNQIPQSLPVSIVPARVNGADFFRVRVGPVASRDEAESLRDQMWSSGLANGRVVSGD